MKYLLNVSLVPKRLYVLSLLTIALGLIPIHSWAFKISPCMRVLKLVDGIPTQDKVRDINFCGWLKEDYKSAVHEHMVLSSILLYAGRGGLNINKRGWKYPYLDKEEWAVRYVESNPWGMQPSYHLTKAIIYGVWWNDDPLMTMLYQGKDFLSGVNKFKNILEPGQARYPTSQLGVFIDAKDHLGHESHFGTLQHLHFMSDIKDSKITANERIKFTTDKALNWIRFAYDVATKVHHPDDPLTDKMDIGFSLKSIGLNVGADPKNLKVKSLFTPTSMDPDQRLKITHDVALGSMFHVIEDSWSSSHTCRVERSLGSKKIAVLKDVYNYDIQSKDKKNGGEPMHNLQDRYPTWLVNNVAQKNYQPYENGPVEVSAWLLSAVDQRLPWNDVETHLRNTIFAKIDDPSQKDGDCLFKRPKECVFDPLTSSCSK
ncbi:hypothetical protein [Methylophilus luteus]|uniref:Uncharacterized protein n=1 Tax=Methylophilus luteus TaxID=640108 RepID=A0ABW3F8C7_9PROT